MFAFQGLLLALLSRARTNRGQLVDVSLLDSVAALLTTRPAGTATGEVPTRTGNRHMTIAPSTPTKQQMASSCSPLEMMGSGAAAPR
jgi:crotonobetainyl-CoA:carnitine CoA-transferase CaiB-like acyl-CoA transferase